MPVNVNKPSPAVVCKWIAVTVGTITLALMVSFLYAYLYHNLELLWH